MGVYELCILYLRTWLNTMAFISLVPKINVATIQNPPLLDDQRC